MLHPSVPPNASNAPVPPRQIPPRHPRVFWVGTNMANSHQQMTPPRKVFFKMCFIEKGSQILKPGIFLGVCSGNQKDIPKSSLQNLIKGHLTLSPPPILSLRCCHDHCFQNLTIGSFKRLLAKREGSSPCLFESLVNLWEIHKSFVMAKKFVLKPL